MALLSKDARALILAALAVMAEAAMVLSSCSAQTDYCRQIVPCNETTCSNYCSKNNFKNFQAYCKPGERYDYCCCRVPSMAG